jgi:hypothetical protein
MKIWIPNLFILIIAGLAAATNIHATALSFLIGDEGKAAVYRVTPGNPTLSWSIPLVGNRDFQLIGNNRFLANFETGFSEFDLTTGALLKKTPVPGIGAIESMRRLKDGRTIVAANATNGIVFVYLSVAGLEQRRFTYPIANPTFRMMRYTNEGHFLFGSGDRVIECDSMGKELRNIKLPASGGLRITAYKVVKKGNGVLWATTGYAKGLVEISAEGVAKNLIIDSTLKSNFYNDFQIMGNGHIFITDWWGHGPGNGGKGIMLREFDEQGKEIWKWQDSVLASSPHSVIVLDGLNLEQLYDDYTGIQLSLGSTKINDIALIRTKYKSSPTMQLAGHQWASRNMLNLLGRMQILAQ